MAAIAVALTARGLLPFPTQHEALHQFVGLMQQRVLANSHKDKTFADRSPLQHFLRACDRSGNVRRWITSSAPSSAELFHVRRELADFAVYLAFATYASVPKVGDDSGKRSRGPSPGYRGYEASGPGLQSFSCHFSDTWADPKVGTLALCGSGDLDVIDRRLKRSRGLWQVHPVEQL